MSTSLAIRNRILELCGKKDITIHRLSILCGLPASSIKNIVYGKSLNPKILTIKIICDGLGITYAEFFSSEEFNGLDQEIQ